MELDAALAQLDALVRTLQRDGDERALLALDLVDAIHRPGLERLADGDVDHPLAQRLLAMYDLAPVEPEILAEEALDEVRPYIESHGGHVELLRVDGGEVHLRLGGACHGCAASAMTLTRGVEQALREHLPGFERLVAHEPEPAPLQIEQVPGSGGALPMAPLRRPVFVDVGPADDPAPGDLRRTRAGDADVLLVNVGGELYALRDGCPVDGLSLEGGRLAGDVIVCPWHNCAYDARSGRRVDGVDGPGLGVVPIAVQDRSVKVAVDVA